ncbi:MAG: YkgJ family cysteine cluster protein [Acidobacteria bacterium]|nr:MAG: YkgJ family cysteine cluster protein [Acidobacteriota bacterium]
MRWIKGGLRFECQPDCGQCCTQSIFGNGEVEGVFLTKRDARRLAKAGLDWAVEERDGYLLLAEKDGTCVFLDEKTKGCGIYANRPTQCRNFPFTPGRDSPLATRERWAVAREGCPGIDVGRFYDKTSIRKLVRGRGEHGGFRV